MVVFSRMNVYLIETDTNDHLMSGSWKKLSKVLKRFLVCLFVCLFVCFWSKSSYKTYFFHKNIYILLIHRISHEYASHTTHILNTHIATRLTSLTHNVSHIHPTHTHTQAYTRTHAHTRTRTYTHHHPHNIHMSFEELLSKQKIPSATGITRLE